MRNNMKTHLHLCSTNVHTWAEKEPATTSGDPKLLGYIRKTQPEDLLSMSDAPWHF